MITLNAKRLVEMVREADAFKLPDMSKGTGYLFDSVYAGLSRGEDVILSNIDFNTFELEDLDSLVSLYSDTFEKNYHGAIELAATLREAIPVCKVVAYV